MPLSAERLEALLSDTVIDRFSGKLIEDENGCWIYQGAPSSRNYGVFSLATPVKLSISAHKAALIMTLGRDLLPGMQANHECDTPLCCRVGPGHVYEGTHSQNMQDRHNRGRYPTRYASRLLPDEHVRSIRREWVPYVVSTYFLAEKYGVSRSVIQGILNGTKYKDVGP
jgi:hypothetical protein